MMRSCAERKIDVRKMEMERLLLTSLGALGSGHAQRQHSIPRTVLSFHLLKCELAVPLED